MKPNLLAALVAAWLWQTKTAWAQLPSSAASAANAVRPTPMWSESGAPSTARAVLKIGPQEWSAQDFALLLAAAGVPAQLDTDTLAAVVDTFVEQRALARRAEADGVAADPRVAEKLALARDRILADEERERLWKQAPVDDAAVKATYDAHPGDYDELQLSQILVRTNRAVKRRSAAQALAVTRSIRRQWAGGASFGALARKYSEDEASRTDCGRLPTIFARDLRPEMAQAIAALKPQQVSEPVVADDGYHLIRLDERTHATFEARRQLLAIEKQKRWVDDRVRALRESASVRFDAAAWLAERDQASEGH